MNLRELAQTDWDDIEAVYTLQKECWKGQFRISKHGYLVCDLPDGKQRKILLRNIDFTEHK